LRQAKFPLTLIAIMRIKGEYWGMSSDRQPPGKREAVVRQKFDNHVIDSGVTQLSMMAATSSLISAYAADRMHHRFPLTCFGLRNRIRFWWLGTRRRQRRGVRSRGAPPIATQAASGHVRCRGRIGPRESCPHMTSEISTTQIFWRASIGLKPGSAIAF
jgi:hypothetical protein